MGWTSYYTDRTNKEECLHIISSYKGTCKKTVMKGNKFYALMTTPNGEDFVVCILTSRTDGEFYYKTFCMNPSERGTPISILKEFVPTTEDDKVWLEKSLKEYEEGKKKLSYDFGDILKLKNSLSGEISWNGTSYKIKPNDIFYVRVIVLNPFSKKKTKAFNIVKESEGKFFGTNLRIAANTMKLMQVLGKEV